jgi:hypothetical protein
VAHHINDPAQKLFVERSRDGTPVGSAHKVFVERSRDEKPMNIRTPRLPSGATLRLAQKLYVERSRDENTGWYSSTPRLRSGCTRLLLHSPRVEGCPKGGVSSSATFKNCSSSEAETKTPVGSAHKLFVERSRDENTGWHSSPLGFARGALGYFFIPLVLRGARRAG